MSNRTADMSDARMIRSMVTPEGVDLKLRIATVGDRAGALVVDGLIMIAVLIGCSIVTGLALYAVKGEGAEIFGVIWLLGFFLLRNAYFIAFELGPRAATPGKRGAGLRVAARNGGRLTAEAVFARNIMREIELFLPATMLLAQAGGAGGWEVLFGIVWTGIFALFPLFNRDRLRVGDFVAGTWVVKAPKAKLLADLSSLPAAALGDLHRLDFSQSQLSAYGVKELYVLEDVLRAGDRTVMTAVAKRIRGKIGWAGAPGETDAAFLAAYYAGLRGRLEQRLLFGHRRADKFDKA